MTIYRHLTVTLAWVCISVVGPCIAYLLHATTITTGLESAVSFLVFMLLGWTLADELLDRLCSEYNYPRSR